LGNQWLAFQLHDGQEIINRIVSGASRSWFAVLKSDYAWLSRGTGLVNFHQRFMPPAAG
jgi:hypothetical protein